MTEKEYLELFKISERKYIIGIFQDTITVYKQQMRALNIFHSLVEEKIINPGTDVSIGIIGGGVAGLTFAAAALKANMSVSIFEKEAEFLHMQQGCDTRKIHPNLYEWPDKGSTFPMARLPVLSWSHDTASNVAKQIVGGLNEIHSQIKPTKNEGPDLWFNSRKRDEVLSISKAKFKESLKFRIDHQYYESTKPTKATVYVDLIIYAVGYGVERNLIESATAGYWRNDALSQSNLTNIHNFFVSGIGDGALVDLCRIKIRNYSYDRMLVLLKKDKKKYDALVERLREIKMEGIKDPDRPANFYMTKFTKLVETIDCDYFWNQVIPDIIIDSYVTLNTRRPDDEVLDFEKVSTINAFVVFMLKRDGHFTTKRGVLTFSGSKKLIDGVEVTGFDQFVIRHGTNKDDVTMNMHLDTSELERLKELKSMQETAGYGKTYWTFQSISECFRKGSTNPKVIRLPYVKRSEFVTPDTRSFCLGPIVSLSKTLSMLNMGVHFRLSLHRVTKFDDTTYFQQIIPYQGSKKVLDYGCFGNVYLLNHGLVGQAAVSGLPVCMLNKNKKQFDQLRKDLDLNKEHLKDVKSTDFLAIPILAPTESGDMAANLILYIEAENLTFFDNNGTLKAIMSGLNGLIGYIELMLKENVISMNELEFSPQQITNAFLPEIEGNESFNRLDKLAPTLFPEKYPFQFEEFYSFDIIYNR